MASLAPEVVAAIEALIDERVAEALAAEPAAQEWVSMAEYAQRDGCSYDSVRMRKERGRIESRSEGRSVRVLWRGASRASMSPNNVMAPAQRELPEARPQEVQLP